MKWVIGFGIGMVIFGLLLWQAINIIVGGIYIAIGCCFLIGVFITMLWRLLRRKAPAQKSQ